MSAGLAPLGWFGIARLGLVQSAIGAIVMLSSSLLNRIMVVEFGAAAALPAGLVAFHYGIQLSRPKWGHRSDTGKRRTPWIIGGIGVLALGGVLATQATLLLAGNFAPALALAILAYAMIGLGVGAAGTSLLALLATRTAPPRRPAAASLTWIMMILGIVVTASIAGQLLDPFSPGRLMQVAMGVAGGAFVLACAAVVGVEGPTVVQLRAEAQTAAFGPALRGIWADPVTLDRLQLVLPENEDALALGDFDALAIALRNLIENALRHGGSGRITVTVEAPATVRVTDDGPGVTPQQLELLRHRHVRYLQDTSGYGLGMSIVNTLMERQRGELILTSPPPGQPHGFQASLRLLPCAPATQAVANGVEAPTCSA